jgi:hypothetical protein
LRLHRGKVVNPSTACLPQIESVRRLVHAVGLLRLRFLHVLCMLVCLDIEQSCSVHQGHTRCCLTVSRLSFRSGKLLSTCMASAVVTPSPEAVREVLIYGSEDDFDEFLALAAAKGTAGINLQGGSSSPGSPAHKQSTAAASPEDFRIEVPPGVLFEAIAAPLVRSLNALNHDGVGSSSPRSPGGGSDGISNAAALKRLCDRLRRLLADGRILGKPVLTPDVKPWNHSMGNPLPVSPSGFSQGSMILFAMRVGLSVAAIDTLCRWGAHMSKDKTNGGAGMLHYIMDKKLGYDPMLVKRLVDAGAAVNAATRSGIRPLHVALLSQNWDAIRVLCDSPGHGRGGDLDVLAMTQFGGSGIDMAVKCEAPRSIISRLLKVGNCDLLPVCPSGVPTWLWSVVKSDSRWFRRRDAILSYGLLKAAPMHEMPTIPELALEQQSPASPDAYITRRSSISSVCSGFSTRSCASSVFYHVGFLTGTSDYVHKTSTGAAYPSMFAWMLGMRLPTRRGSVVAAPETKIESARQIEKPIKRTLPVLPTTPAASEDPQEPLYDVQRLSSAAESPPSFPTVLSSRSSNSPSPTITSPSFAQQIRKLRESTQNAADAVNRLVERRQSISKLAANPPLSSPLSSPLPSPTHKSTTMHLYKALVPSYSNKRLPLLAAAVLSSPSGK